MQVAIAALAAQVAHRAVGSHACGCAGTHTLQLPGAWPQALRTRHHAAGQKFVAKIKKGAPVFENLGARVLPVYMIAINHYTV